MNKHPTVRKQTPNINKYQHLTLFAFRLMVFQYFTTTCTLCLSYRQILVVFWFSAYRFKHWFCFSVQHSQ